MRSDSLLAARFVRFILIGISNTLLSFLVFQTGLFLLKGFRLRAAGAQVAGYSAGVLWSYYWNRRWSFRSSRNVEAEFPRFLTAQLLCLSLSTAAMWTACDYARFPATWAWAVVMAGITIINFSLLQYWVFRPEAPSRVAPGRRGVDGSPSRLRESG
jgi:putative flippase GtrA